MGISGLSDGTNGATPVVVDVSDSPPQPCGSIASIKPAAAIKNSVFVFMVLAVGSAIYTDKYATTRIC
jgi:hypothetical protein